MILIVLRHREKEPPQKTSVSTAVATVVIAQSITVICTQMLITKVA